MTVISSHTSSSAISHSVAFYLLTLTPSIKSKESLLKPRDHQRNDCKHLAALRMLQIIRPEKGLRGVWLHNDPVFYQMVSY